MNQGLHDKRAGVAAGDGLVVLSLLCLVLAVVYPLAQRAAYEDRVDAVVLDIEAVKASAQLHRERAGAWPAESPSGTTPTELLGALPADFTPVTAHHTLDWDLWEIVRAVSPSEHDTLNADPNADPDPGATAPADVTMEQPQPQISPLHALAGITVYSEEEALLAALLQRYGQELSFVGEGRWTLILADAGQL